MASDWIATLYMCVITTLDLTPIQGASSRGDGSRGWNPGLSPVAPPGHKNHPKPDLNFAPF